MESSGFVIFLSGLFFLYKPYGLSCPADCITSNFAGAFSSIERMLSFLGDTIHINSGI